MGLIGGCIMHKMVAIAFGIIFIALGVIGFVPELMHKGMFLGTFKLNALHNAVHLGTGVIALWVAFSSSSACRIFFQVFGIVYALIAILGFIYKDQMILGILSNNRPDSWFHLAVAAVSLYLGFAVKAGRK